MNSRVFLSGATLVLPDRLESGRTLVLEDGRIADVAVGPRGVAAGEERLHLPGHFVVPGFVDVHVHGVAGRDVLDGREAIADVAAVLPRYGVTAFCPTSIACPPATLKAFLAGVGACRRTTAQGARVLGAHLESNFISALWAGAQPVSCLRIPASALSEVRPGETAAGEFSAREVLDVIRAHRADVAILTLAPELEGGLDLVRELSALGIRVSLGHSGASFDEAQAAIGAGARHATHLFNRMPPLTHRAPGLAGAVLASDEIAAEVIADGYHVHPAVVRTTVAAKGASRVMAITDGTAGSGLARGARATLGERTITVGDAATLDDGTLAGSVATMDRVFACLVNACGIDLRTAAEICATTPARELGLVGHGVIAAGASADLAVLGPGFRVVQTWIGGRIAWSTGTSTLPSPSTSP